MGLQEAAFGPYRGTSALFASSLEEVGVHSDHVGVCVGTDDDVREVCAALLPAMKAGTRLAIHSTIHPATCREMEALAAKRGVEVIDAPVSGGSPAAEAGILTLMLKGELATIAKSMPVFETFGRLIVRLGGVGAGQHVKLLNNSLLLAKLGLVEAVLGGGGKLGVNRDALLNLLLNGSGESFALEVRSRMDDRSSFRHGGTLLRKDLRLLGELLGENDEAAKVLRDASVTFVSAAV